MEKVFFTNSYLFIINTFSVAEILSCYTPVNVGIWYLLHLNKMAGGI